MSIDAWRQKYLILALEKTDHSRALLHRENMTLPYGISGVINPLENHSCSMILSLLHTSISYHNAHPPYVILRQ